MTDDREHRPRVRLGPRPVAVLRKALQSRNSALREAMPTPKREFQDRSDHGPIEDAGRPTYQTARTTVAADFVFDPFPPPREYMPALPHDAEPGQLAPCSGDVRPRGPDLAKVAEIAAAIMKRNTERRASWRQENLALSSEDEQQRDLLEGNGRVRVASPAAFQKYLKRGFGLIETYRHEINMRASREDVDPRSFANWVAARRPLLKPGTWRVYRQAAIAVILTIPSAYIDEAIGMLNEDLQVGADKGRHTAGPHASDDQQAIAKFMKFDHFQRLKQRLREMGTSEVCLALLDRMDASVSTGLRQMEWELAFIEKRADRACRHGERIWLHVVAGRAEELLGTYRSLDISKFGAEILKAIERTVQRSHAWALSGQSATWQSEISKLFCSTCEALFPRMQLCYTLYSLRHQFIANMSSIYSREQVVAMTGNDMTHVQREHYVKQRISWTERQFNELPGPVPEQVARIKVRLRFLDERREIKAMKDAARQRDQDSCA
jgi:hypothetical protein